MNKQSFKINASRLAVAIGIVLVAALLFNLNIGEVIQTGGQRGWHNLAYALDATTVGKGGVYFIYIYPHSATPGTTYAVNLTNASAYAYGNLNTTLTGYVPFATTFDIVIKCGYNTSQAYNTTGTKWMNTWVRANLTCAALGIAADTTMSMRNIVNGTDMWVHYYLNNGGAGYTITRNQAVNVTSFKMYYFGV